jgi:peroxiredoxin
MAVKVGDRIPDCQFLRPDKTLVRLSEFRAQALVLIFLRHLA